MSCSRSQTRVGDGLRNRVINGMDAMALTRFVASTDSLARFDQVSRKANKASSRNQATFLALIGLRKRAIIWNRPAPVLAQKRYRIWRSSGTFGLPLTAAQLTAGRRGATGWSAAILLPLNPSAPLRTSLLRAGLSTPKKAKVDLRCSTYSRQYVLVHRTRTHGPCEVGRETVRTWSDMG